MGKRFELTMLGILDSLQELRTHGEDEGWDWVEDTLNEINQDTISQAGHDELVEEKGFFDVEEILESGELNDEEMETLLRTWAQCIQDLAEIEVSLADL